MLETTDGKSIKISQFNLDSFKEIRKSDVYDAFAYSEMKLELTGKEIKEKASFKKEWYEGEYSKHKTKSDHYAEELQKHGVDVTALKNEYSVDRSVREGWGDEVKKLWKMYWECKFKCVDAKRDIQTLSAIIEHTKDTQKVKLSPRQAMALEYPSTE